MTPRRSFLQSLATAVMAGTLNVLPRFGEFDRNYVPVWKSVEWMISPEEFYVLIRKYTLTGPTVWTPPAPDAASER